MNTIVNEEIQNTDRQELVDCIIERDIQMKLKEAKDFIDNVFYDEE